MKHIYSTLVLIFSLSFLAVSCRDSAEMIEEINQVENLLKIKELTNSTHIIELYSATGTTVSGYNELKMRIKNKNTNQYEKNAVVSWKPVMHMTSMMHSGPKSAIVKDMKDVTLYSGYLVFQMPQNATEYWDLTIDYTISGTAYTATSIVDVPLSSKSKVSTFLGSDNVKYIVAYIDPKTPKVALNDLKVGVWKMQDMMNFPVVDGYTLKIDPRMPGMGNHSSPNNVHATQAGSGNLYNGKLSLTMTGYWKINLQIVKADGTVVKGENVTDTNPASSVFFEIEF
ncbi:hypothetical protein [Chryseobacterium sp. MP_3.2]|uniref:hypothetical protein n=1 Tax=Chryseobacterium sp. MP_3.2 TaxID=3071712 RepID=UPI002E0B9EA1|nr:hypothetical protein [Chryseobacterium sp. MP_3.2]